MININNFKIDRSLDPVKQNKILVNFIQKFVDNKNLDNLLIKLSTIYKIPKEVFDQDVKLLVFSKYRNSKGKFLPNYGFLQIFISLFKYTLFYLWVAIFSKNNKNLKTKKYDLIIDDVDHHNTLWRFKSFVNQFRAHIFVTTYKPNGETFYFWDNYKGLDKKISFNHFSKVLILILLSLKNSLLDRTNYLDIIFALNRKIIKYRSIFSKIQSDYLIQDRCFMSSSLKNYIFKEHKGKKTLLYQRNIAQLNGPGMYTVADYFFSMGNKTHVQYLKCDSKFEKVFPVGSFFMDSVKIKKGFKSDVPKFDLLHIASNMNHFQNTHNTFLDDWYEQFNWLIKFKKKFPKYKVGIKGRENDGLRENKKFMNLIKNSEIVFIDSFNDPKDKSFRHNTLHSYDFAFEAKVNCTWQSTLGFELIGHGKPCIFLDPGGRNIAHLPNDNYHNIIKVKSYNEFEKEFFEIINNTSRFNNLNTNDYCIQSNLTHQKIYEILNKH
tara:strand:- start:3047 stop:4522 length:1476 start_codon:yes stop_codon:yes gene_type:complete